MIHTVKDVWALFSMFELGLISPLEVRSFAASALREPVDNDLLQIVICDEDDSDGITKAANSLFTRHGLQALTKADVLRIYAAHVAGLIVHGDIPPREGADLIATATERHPVVDFHDLDAFKYASSEMQDRPEDKSFFEKAVAKEAAAWNARREELRAPS